MLRASYGPPLQDGDDHGLIKLAIPVGWKDETFLPAHTRRGPGACQALVAPAPAEDGPAVSRFFSLRAPRCPLRVRPRGGVHTRSDHERVALGERPHGGV